MSLKNLLDLRKKEVQIIERIIFQKRSWKTESLKLLAVIAVVSTVIYGISNADVKQEVNTHSKTIGVYGVISNISENTLTLTKKTKPTELTNDIYTVTLSDVKKIETKNYAAFSLNDLMEGDTVIVQGVNDNNTIDASRIIFFSHAPTTPVAATSTEATSTATTTEQTVTSTDATETSSATSTDEATTSIQVATTTEATTSDASSTPTLVEKVVGVVTDTINKVIDTVTGTSSPDTPETPAPTVDTPPAPEAPADITPSAPAPSSESPPAETTTN